MNNSINENKIDDASSLAKYFRLFILRNPFQGFLNNAKQVRTIFIELKKT